MHSVLASLLSLCPACASVPAQAEGPASSPPNVLLIVSDDQGWADIGVHAQEVRSPHLDRLFREGVELDCHYVQPQCTPTRVALMSGRFPSRWGPHCTTASNERAFPPGTKTMASWFQAAGYETALSGKWHLGSKPEWGPNHYGFDESYGSLAGAIGMYDHRYRLNSPFVQTWHRNHEFREDEGHATDLVTEEAERFLRREREGPFFLYVPYHSVHTPIVEEESWLEGLEHVTNPDRKLFLAAVRHLDACVGRLLAALDETGQREDTIVVFTSDNGGLENYGGGNYPPPDPALKGYSSNEPLRGQKTDTFEGGFRVPACVSWPGTLAARTVAAPMHVSDWLPTLAGVCGLGLPDDLELDGRDVWPLLTGEREDYDEPRTIYTNWGKGSRLSLRHGDWKLMRNGRKKPWMLFDLAADPNETTDLAREQPQVLADLARRLGLEQALDRDTRKLPAGSRVSPQR